MIGDPLRWRIERACAAAYPPARQEQVGDWIVSQSGGGSRRSNSASAGRPWASLDAATLRALGDAFAAAAQPMILRLTDLNEEADELLDALGLAPPEGATRTLVCPGSTAQPASGSAYHAGFEIVLRDAPDPPWLAMRRRLAPAVEDPAAVAARIAGPTCYARRGSSAIGYVAIHDGIAVIEAIGTDPAQRRQGHARTIVKALVGWAAHAGAEHVALQVEATNAAARALYASAGFDIDAYGYRYRRSRPCPVPA